MSECSRAVCDLINIVTDEHLCFSEKCYMSMYMFHIYLIRIEQEKSLISAISKHYLPVIS